MKKIILNLGEEFEPKKAIIKDYESGYLNEFKYLFQCYDRPSQTKERVYNYYYDLLVENCDKIINYGVRGFNSCTISLHAIIIKDGKKYYLLITKNHNYYTELLEA